MKKRSSISHEEIIAFLCDPRSYPHHPKRIRFVQTHASYVFLGSPYVFKVKKKVNFGFLDFSTLKKRRYYSEREVFLNRRLCPDIYLGVVPISLSAGRIENLKISTSENFDQTRDFVGVTISKEAFEAIAFYTSLFYARKAKLLSARVRERRIRDCHGDLHLEHVHLAPKTLSIFDCIEFNDRFRCIDVASDVAFLAMDFDHHDRADLSRQITAPRTPA